VINVLSLFDGLSGARIALDQLGIECNYYASEVDKYAMKVSAANYLDIIQLGDVTKVRAEDLPKIDLLIGGSPCQDLSVAKTNRKGLEGEKQFKGVEFTDFQL
jgi:site-specific DNA-cytosine methylase